MTEDMLVLKLQKPDGFTFKAGQFVQVQVPDPEKPVFRAYSICSTPTDPTLDLCIKIVPGGKASMMFAAASEGDTISFRGPLGHFTVPEGIAGAHFIATGAGISPILSMIRERAASTLPMTLLFGIRSLQDVCLHEEFLSLQKDYPSLQLTYCLSREPNPPESWQKPGRVTTHLPKILPQEHVFICGSPEMVKEVRAFYMNQGIDKQQIHLEIF